MNDREGLPAINAEAPHARQTPQSGRKVLVISGVFPPARIADGDHAFHICRRLAERGFQIEVLTSRGSVSANLPFIVHPIMSRWNWYELPRLVRVTKQFAPDIVFLWFVGQAYRFHPMITFAPTALKRALPNVTIVTQITFPVWSAPERHSLLTRAAVTALAAAMPTAVDYRYGTLFRDSDAIIGMAPAHLEDFARRSRHVAERVRTKSVFIPPPPLLLMAPPGAESRMRGRRALNVPDENLLFAFFGRLYRGKGLETLLDSFQRLRTLHPKVKLAIIGGAAEDMFGDPWRVDPLYDQARALQIEAGVVWTGEFPWDSDLGSTYLRAADIAVLPFDRGVNLNNSSFAAVAAHGLPTITTRGAVVERQFKNGENVLLCPPRNPDALASAMDRLLVDVDLRQRLRSGIDALAKKLFSWDVAVDRTIAAFSLARARRSEP